MTTSEVALATYDLVFERLGTTMPFGVRKPEGDPSPLPKDRLVCDRVRLLPVVPKPESFWALHWCYYEIRVERSTRSAGCFGKVHFVMYPNIQACGSGCYRARVLDILTTLKPAARRRFFLNPKGGPKRVSILCGFDYRIGEFTSFPIETSAADLVWLIRNTIERFAALD